MPSLRDVGFHSFRGFSFRDFSFCSFSFRDLSVGARLDDVATILYAISLVATLAG